MKLNIGCGSSFEGDVRLDIKQTKSVTIIADTHFIPFKAESFSYVICTEVLEHLHSPLQALEEICRVLNKNGKVFITVPNLTEIRRILSISRPPLKFSNIPGRSNHKQGWDAIEFQRLAHQAKLRVLKINWIDLYSRKGRRYNVLNPILKRILPRSLFYLHMKIVCKKE